MDALNRLLSWDVNPIIANSLFRLSHYGHGVDHILSQTITLQSPPNSNNLKDYFSKEYLSDVLAIVLFFDLHESLSAFYLVDLYILLVIFGRSSIESKLMFLFEWFNVSKTGSLDEFELEYLFTRIRFCLRKLGIKSIEFSAERIRYIAFTFRLVGKNELKASLSRDEFVLIAKDHEICKRLTQLVQSFRKIPHLLRKMESRLALLESFQAANDEDEFNGDELCIMPTPPMHYFPLLPLDSAGHLKVFPTYCGQNVIHLSIPSAIICPVNHHVYLKILTNIYLKAEPHGAAYSGPYRTISSYRTVQSLRTTLPYITISIPNLRPDTDYEICIYNSKYMLSSSCLHVKTLPINAPIPSSPSSPFEFIILSPTLTTSDLSTIASLLPGGSGHHQFVLLTGRICPLPLNVRIVQFYC